MPIWKTTVLAALHIAALAALELARQQTTYRVPVVDGDGRVVQ